MTFAIKWLEPEIITLKTSWTPKVAEMQGRDRLRGGRAPAGRREGGKGGQWGREKSKDQYNEIYVRENVTVKSISFYANQKLMLKKPQR